MMHNKIVRWFVLVGALNVFVGAFAMFVLMHSRMNASHITVVESQRVKDPPVVFRFAPQQRPVSILKISSEEDVQILLAVLETDMRSQWHEGVLGVSDEITLADFSGEVFTCRIRVWRGENFERRLAIQLRELRMGLRHILGLPLHPKILRGRGKYNWLKYLPQPTDIL